MSAPITKVAVVGTGVIGASWAALFLAKGMDVCAADPAPGAEAALRRAIASHWLALSRSGLVPGGSLDRLTFVATPEEAVADAHFVQENGPENLAVKRSLFARLDAASGPETILASSSSTLMVSTWQDICRRPERVLLGHPFNPPHLIPLVEVVGGPQTSPSSLDKAMAFYTAMDRRPILLRKEMVGHVANRLQAALWREAFHMVADGAVSVADIDTAISHGPGLRWALLGPFLNLDMSGGSGGMEHLLDHIGPAIEAMWRDLGSPSMDSATKRAVLEGMDAVLAGRDRSRIAAQRDEALQGILALKATRDELA